MRPVENRRGFRRLRAAGLALATASVLSIPALAFSSAAGHAALQDSADVSVSEATSSPQAAVRRPVTFVVTVTNNGPVDATRVRLGEVLAGSVTFDSSSISLGKCTRTKLTFTCFLGKLTVGQSVTATFVATPTEAGAVSGSASVGAAQADPNTSNQTSQAMANAVWTDQTAPTGAAVFIANRNKPPKFVVSTAFPLRWSAAGGMSGLTSFDIRYREARTGKGFGSFVQWSRASTSSHHTVFTGHPGSTYCFSARATNRAGLTSRWSEERCTAVPRGVHAYHFAKPWVMHSGRSYFGGSSVSASLPGSKLTVHLRGAKRIAIVATRCPTCGDFYVVWKGKVLDRVSLVGQYTKPSVLVPVASFRAPTSGTLELVIASNNKRVQIDGLAVSRV